MTQTDNEFKQARIQTNKQTKKKQTNKQTETIQSDKTYEANWLARLSMLSSSRFVVGSSRVNIPQFKQNVSARANLIINDAKTCLVKKSTKN